MGYSLNAIIGTLGDLEKVKEEFKSAKTFSLTDEIAFTPMTENLFDEINNFRINNRIGNFVYLTTDIENEILRITMDRMISYVEIDYWGGVGIQRGIIWKDGQRIYEKELENEVVNEILKKFGIIRSNSKDEFKTIGLDRERNSEDWM